MVWAILSLIALVISGVILSILGGVGGIGLLVALNGFSEAEAYGVLRNKAMQSNVKLAEVAQRIIDMADLLG